MKTIKEILSLSTDYLTKHNCPSPRLEAEWLISHALGLTRMDLYMQHDRPLDEDELGKIRPMLDRRGKHEPVQYICGSTEFYGIEIHCGPGVLIPRPETERLVDLALEKVEGKVRILDVCTGTACIALALAKELPDAEIIAIDLSPEALKYAQKNKDFHKLDNVTLLQGDLFAPLATQEPFDLIVSNPPYVTEEEYVSLDSEVKAFEPQSALTAPNAGLEILYRLAVEAKDLLKPGAYLLCEMGIEQGPATSEFFAQHGYEDVQVVQDYTSRDRIISGRKKVFSIK